MYSEMIFVSGFVHCDPHPGNVLVRKCPRSNKTEIVLLDHGLYQVRHRPSLAAHNKANPSHITGHYSPAASPLSEPPVLRRRKSISLETTCSSAMCFRTALLHTHTHAHAGSLANGDRAQNPVHFTSPCSMCVGAVNAFVKIIW